MSEVVTRALRRELGRPTFDSWVARIRERNDTVRPIDVEWALDEVRIEYDPDERFDAR